MVDSQAAVDSLVAVAVAGSLVAHRRQARVDIRRSAAAAAADKCSVAAAVVAGKCSAAVAVVADSYLAAAAAADTENHCCTAGTGLAVVAEAVVLVGQRKTGGALDRACTLAEAPGGQSSGRAGSHTGPQATDSECSSHGTLGKWSMTHSNKPYNSLSNQNLDEGRIVR